MVLIDWYWHDGTTSHGPVLYGIANDIVRNRILGCIVGLTFCVESFLFYLVDSD
jgi:hypothetical protein